MPGRRAATVDSNTLDSTGLSGALLASTLDAFLVGVGRWDPWVFAAVPVVLAVAALAACAATAVREARLEPTRALASE